MTVNKYCIVCESDITNESLGMCSKRKYCKRCKKILDRAETRKHKVVKRKFRVVALQKAWDRDNKVFRCYYSDVSLDCDDHKNPRYLVFDHRMPNKPDDIVVAATVINQMKSDMTEEEFKKMIEQLYKRYHCNTPLDEKVFGLKCWRR